MGTVVTITLNPAVDVSTAIDSVAPDRKLRCSPPRFEPGGGGVNVSRAMVRLGAPSHAIYLAGGLHGELLRHLLDQEGLHHEALPIAFATRENLMVFERSTGAQFRFGMPGPRVSREEWQGLLARLERLDPVPDLVVASGSLPPGLADDAYCRIAEVVRGLGAELVLDSSGAALRRGLEGRPFLIKPNLGEFRRLVGEELALERDQVAAARWLIEQFGIGAVVVSLGAAGARLVTAELDEHVPAPTVNVRSKIGAGDSTVAGIVTALSRGEELLEAVRFGVATGAATTMTDGSELCRLEDVERLYASMS